jgi:predicted lipoprotein with Yx(FWY)xxD motif
MGRSVQELVRCVRRQHNANPEAFDTGLRLINLSNSLSTSTRATHMFKPFFIASSIALGLLASNAFAQAVKSTDGLMTDAQGKTLYTFTKDSANKSNCAGACLAAWPAFVPKPEAKASGDLGIIQRDDGVRQWTYKERPLYYFAGDAKPGDKLGDKQNGVWFVVPFPADGKVSKAPAAAANNEVGYKY